MSSNQNTDRPNVLPLVPELAALQKIHNAAYSTFYIDKHIPLGIAILLRVHVFMKRKDFSKRMTCLTQSFQDVVSGLALL